MFSTKDAVKNLNDSRRKDPTKARKKRSRPKRSRKLSDQYTRRSYHNAIDRACKKAGVPHWHPHQLRHTAATKIRSLYGLDVATIVLGHKHRVTSEIYADADFKKAIEVMREIG
ncbi:MAG: site-specific integrase [Pirellulales bacterium]